MAREALLTRWHRLRAEVKTAEHALMRIAQRELPSVGELVVDTNGDEVVTRIPRVVADELMAGHVFIGFFNKSGEAPEAEDLQPAARLPDDERAEMGLPPLASRQKRLPAIGETGDEPFRVQERVGMAPLYRDWRRGTVYRAAATITAHSYVTHFAVGSRRDGVLLVGTFHRPIKMAAGRQLQFGMRMPPDLDIPALPAPSLAPDLAFEEMLRLRREGTLTDEDNSRLRRLSVELQQDRERVHAALDGINDTMQNLSAVGRLLPTVAALAKPMLKLSRQLERVDKKHRGRMRHMRCYDRVKQRKTKRRRRRP